MSKRLSTEAAPLVTLLALLVLAGTGLRFWDLGFPNHLTWDEHHFVENARNYLSGKPDWNDHPPLGKLFMALSMHAFGDTSFAFRLPSALLGSCSILAAGLLGQAVFGSKRAGWIAAAFVAIDGFLVSYSRTALLDGMLTSLTLWSLYLMTRPGVPALLTLSLVIGSGMAIKLSAIALFGPLAALCLLRALSGTPWGAVRLKEARLFGRPLRAKRAELATYPLVPVIAFFTFLGWWRLGLDLSNQPHGYGDAYAQLVKMVEHHAALTDWKHPLLSRWWTWPLPTKPIMIRHDSVGAGVVRVSSTLGNPLLWWSVVLAFLATCGSAVRSLARRRAPAWGECWLALSFLAYLSPWIITNRDSYIYHYLPSYSVGLVLLAGYISVLSPTAETTSDQAGFFRWKLARRMRNSHALLPVLAVVAVVSAYYAPVWAQRPIASDALRSRPLIRGL